MIIVENLRKKFGSKEVLKGINFTVNDGEIYGLLGPNGSGKSTTMRILSGIITDFEGKVMVAGVDVSRDPMKVKEIVGYVPETPALYESLTPAEFFSFIGGVRRIPQDILEERVKRLVDAFGIGKYMNQLIGTLSFGTKQKISLISALLHDPQVLILDEAMNGLDPKSARIFRELLFEFKEEGKSIVFSTHILALAEVMCDRIGIIYEGRIVAEGTIDELREIAREEKLEDIFLKLTQAKEEVSQIVSALKEAL
ncbi:ABC transporter ATP-binding protein [Pyrococcus horikoshii]|uniref:ABC transporter ATP-binding protein n=2 Tax=Pyrococcus horikoshii TaxID=53953 RepID=A0A832W6W7_PYRHR|nr:ABC transporter ATP-binding protein [Pyrococcus horikoshii]BAA30330.1 253aa long hypothetical ATP-binding transport protein [Pyrococcus horikoshii OT3]HII60243.1 ABC transporter ATP-binding protein [Pyrococcus horikoshii]